MSVGISRECIAIPLALVAAVLQAHAQPPIPSNPGVSIVGRTPSSEEQARAEPLFAVPTSRDHIGRVIIPVVINDQGPFRFLLDTGASHSVLAPQMVSRLGLTLSEQKRSVAGVTGESTVPTVQIRRLEAGALSVNNVHMPVLDATMTGLDGVLGVDGLANKRLTVNFHNDEVIIDRLHNRIVPGEYVTLPARFRHGGLLIVDALVGPIKVKAVIDTGAQASLGTGRLRQLLQRQIKEAQLASPATVEGVTADIQVGDVIHAPMIRFQGVEIEGVRITYGDFHVFHLWGLEKQPALLVGMDILGTVESLIIDYRRGLLHIEPRDTPAN